MNGRLKSTNWSKKQVPEYPPQWRTFDENTNVGCSKQHAEQQNSVVQCKKEQNSPHQTIEELNHNSVSTDPQLVLFYDSSEESDLDLNTTSV